MFQVVSFYREHWKGEVLAYKWIPVFPVFNWLLVLWKKYLVLKEPTSSSRYSFVACNSLYAKYSTYNFYCWKIWNLQLSDCPLEFSLFPIDRLLEFKLLYCQWKIIRTLIFIQTDCLCTSFIRTIFKQGSFRNTRYRQEESTAEIWQLGCKQNIWSRCKGRGFQSCYIHIICLLISKQFIYYIPYLESNQTWVDIFA